MFARTASFRFLFVVLVSLLFPIESFSEVHIDKIEVYKAKHELHLIKNGKLYRSYKVALGDSPTGKKHQEGDEKTPEGKYTINGRNAASHYHLSLRISYPDANDIAWAKRHNVKPGGNIMIHGLPNGKGYIGMAHRLHDWTDGCIALTDEEIEEVWKLVPDGTPIELFP